MVTAVGYEFNEVDIPLVFWQQDDLLRYHAEQLMTPVLNGETRKWRSVAVIAYQPS